MKLKWKSEKIASRTFNFGFFLLEIKLIMKKTMLRKGRIEMIILGSTIFLPCNDDDDDVIIIMQILS